jgi:hypothetical protein
MGLLNTEINISNFNYSNIGQMLISLFVGIKEQSNSCHVNIFHMKNGCYFFHLYLSIYSSAALCWAWGVFSGFWSCTQSVWLLGRGTSSSQGSYLYIEQHEQRINTHRSYLEWDSNSHPRVEASEDSLGLKQRGHCNRLFPSLHERLLLRDHSHAFFLSFYYLQQM